MSDRAMRDLAIYYAATPKSLLVTLSEAVMKRALDRQGTNTSSGSAAGSARPWLGTNLCLQVQRGAIQAVSSLAGGYQSAQQRLCWNNFPILNEWKRLYGAQDPVKVHERFWQTKLVCPAGGTYAWNEKWQTMECSVHGHAGEPKSGPDVPLPLANVIAANMGLTFENQGLSAKIVLEREEKNR
jgi:hypothetical protein